MGNYNERTNLMVRYQWWTKDLIGESGDEPIFAKNFNNSNEALAALEIVMPNGYEFFDGYKPEEFEEEIKKETADISAMYITNIDDTHCLIAIIRPLP